MISRIGYSRALPLIMAAALGIASVPRACAQTVAAGENPDAPAAETAAPDADIPDIRDLDWSQLNVDASTLTKSPASKARSPQAGPGAVMSWSSKDTPDGSSAVSVKQPLSPFWD